MDWNMAIERNHGALKRIVSALVVMAGLGGAASFTSPLWGGRREASGGGRDAANTPTRRSGDRRPPHKGKVEPAFTLPRRLHRAILRLLRPAESAVRRLIIVMARGVTLPPPRPRKPTPPSIFLRKPGGTDIYLPPGFKDRSSGRASGSTVGREGRGDCEAIGVPGNFREASGANTSARALPLLDPLPRTVRRRYHAQSGIPRISFPGVIAPSPITPRLPPAPDDPLDATRLALRLQALSAALDDLPGQARRFARWRARKLAGTTRRSWPLRPGAAPGQRPANRRRHEVHEVLSDLHWLAFEVLEHRDTS